ncbi:NUDIX hydrolase [Streptomyces sp. NPDC052095]|uniref:NUDIX hydrolase n=1 Tax=unclassified Streptomyces TaxID=2593676 RepID=UPI00344F2E79
MHVFDGGIWDEDRIAEIRLPGDEITRVEFVEPARLPQFLSPGDARRALSALRSRINAAGTVLLEDGLPVAPAVLDRLSVLRTARTEQHGPWRDGPAAHGQPVAQVRGWLFAPDGRVLVLLDPGTGAARLPGGAPGARDRDDPVSALPRGAEEYAAARPSTPLLLGHLTDPRTGHAHLRCAATFTETGAPARATPRGRTPVRVLATPEQAAQLFGREESATAQLRAVHRGRERLGVPRAAPQPVTELPRRTV